MARASDKTLNYKNYYGSVEVSVEDGVIHGRLLYIRDVITFESPDVEGVKSAFEEAVDRYLAFCVETGDNPEKPFSGSFNVRVSQPLHRGAVIAADTAGISLNRWVEDAMREKLFPTDQHQQWVQAFSSPQSVSVAAENVWQPVPDDLQIKRQLRIVK